MTLRLNVALEATTIVAKASAFQIGTKSVSKFELPLETCNSKIGFNDLLMRTGDGLYSRILSS